MATLNQIKKRTRKRTRTQRMAQGRNRLCMGIVRQHRTARKLARVEQ